MKCPKFKTESPEGLKFCSECGANGWVTKYEKELVRIST
jgi:hypothetical protein